MKNRVSITLSDNLDNHEAFLKVLENDLETEIKFGDFSLGKFKLDYHNTSSIRGKLAEISLGFKECPKNAVV